MNFFLEGEIRFASFLEVHDNIPPRGISRYGEAGIIARRCGFNMGNQ